MSSLSGRMNIGLVNCNISLGYRKTRNETSRNEMKQDKAEMKRNTRDETKLQKIINKLNKKTNQTLTKLLFFTQDNNPQNASGGLKNL